MKTEFEAKPISLLKSFLIFLLAGMLFYITIKILVPAISAAIGQAEYIVWMFTGSLLLFLPLFLTTFCLLKKDGCKMELREIAKALNLKLLHKKDIAYIAFGTIIASVLCGVIVAVMMLCSKSITVSSLSGVSPIKVSPLQGKQLWFALFLPVFFFFNYVGEETLWRGYLLPRQMIAGYGKFAVILNALFHCVFHFVFGWMPLVMMFPMMVLMPYVVSKTKNTWTSIIIHFLIGAPSQILVIMGLLVH
jgi:membrane protease YdiL (CAAX protease family)